MTAMRIVTRPANDADPPAVGGEGDGDSDAAPNGRNTDVTGNTNP